MNPAVIHIESGHSRSQAHEPYWATHLFDPFARHRLLYGEVRSTRNWRLEL